MVNQLQQFELDDINEVQHEEFKIESLEQANWAFRKLAALNAKENEIKSLVASERQRLDLFEQREIQSIQNDRSFFESLLSVYAIKQREQDPKFKVKTPYGSIGFRKQQPKWEYNDELLIQSLEDIGRHELIRIKKEPDKTSLKKSLQVVNGQVIDPESGAVLEGVLVTPQDDKISISVEV